MLLETASVASVLLTSSMDVFWEECVSNLMCSGHVKEAAIYSLDGVALSSSSESFALQDGELADICALLSRPLVLLRAQVTVGGQTYAVHGADGQRGLLARRGSPPEGCSLCRTSRLLVIATHDNTMSHRVCNDVIMTMGDFLTRKGF